MDWRWFINIYRHVNRKYYATTTPKDSSSLNSNTINLMGLYYMLEQVGYKMGMLQWKTDSGQRAVILRFINTAAKELYHMSDMAGVLDEQLFKINSHQTISLPDYVGQIRAMKENFTNVAVNLSQMRPNYNQYNWSQEWRNWRLKGLYPLQTTLTNQSQLVLTVQAVENPPVVVHISGPTIGSSMMNETVIMNQLSVNTVNEYLDVKSFTKQATSQYDIIMSDIDGNQISYIA